tara:strand:- start:2550 stop:3755 length:1206 start_codon:yes stop_codon:yes gene_type:complete
MGVSLSTPLRAQEDSYGRPEIDGGRSSGYSDPYVPEHPITPLKPGERPPKGSDEEGLWTIMDGVERKLRVSGRVVIDPALQAYVEGIVCKLAPEHCPNIRVYIVRTPHFNANMAPNGVMQVWSGLLLRTQNEAQLAYVLAHELAHYIQRHSLQRWRTVRDTSNAMAFFSVLTAVAGVGFVGSIGQLVAVSALYAYNRDQEREADAEGIAMMTAAGYDPREAPKSWSGLLAEREEKDGKESTVFFATHPPTKERIETLTAEAARLSTGADTIVGQKALDGAVRPHRTAWFEDELLRRKPEQSRRLLQRLLADDGDNGFLLYMLGETYRMEYTDDGNAQALAEFERALAATESPPETLRSMGLIYWDMGQEDAAREHFRRYLQNATEADDRDMVKSYLKELTQ